MRGHSRGRLVGAAVRLVLQVALCLGEGGLGVVALVHVELGVLLDVLPHGLLKHRVNVHGSDHGSGDEVSM